MWERREGVVVRLTCWVFAVQFSAKQYMPLFIYLFIFIIILKASTHEHTNTRKNEGNTMLTISHQFELTQVMQWIYGKNWNILCSTQAYK